MLDCAILSALSCPDIEPSFFFSCLFQPPSPPVFHCIFSFSLQCSDSRIPQSLWQLHLDSQPHSDCLAAHPCELCINHSLTTHPVYVTAPSQMSPPFITHPFPFITHLFLSSFHSFHCLAPLVLPFKLCPVSVPCIAGHHLTPLMSSSGTVQLPSYMSLAPPQPLW